MTSKQSAKSSWLRIFQDALNHDTWGQREEAKEDYERLARVIESQEDELSLTPDERGTVNKMKVSVSMRAKAIQDAETVGDAPGGLSFDQIKSLQSVFNDLFNRPVKFPLNVPTTFKDVDDIDDEDDSEGGAVALKPEAKDGASMPREIAPGSASIEIYIEKIGLKDALTYIESHMTVSVVDPSGNRVLDFVDTPNTNKLKPMYVLFENQLYLDTDMATFMKGCTLFFEFKHFKPKVKKVSTRVFTFMELDEITRANGKMTCLELYKKPTDFSKKRLNLHSIKKLFLHVQVILHNRS